DRLVAPAVPRELPVRLHLREALCEEAGVRRNLRLRARWHRPRRRRGDRLALSGVAVLGAPAATVAAASYLTFVFPLDRLDISLVAAGILLAAFVVNYIGIRFTGRVQVATVIAILVALAIAVVASAPRIAPANYTPFLP